MSQSPEKLQCFCLPKLWSHNVDGCSLNGPGGVPIILGLLQEINYEAWSCFMSTEVQSKEETKPTRLRNLFQFRSRMHLGIVMSQVFFRLGHPLTGAVTLPNCEICPKDFHYFIFLVWDIPQCCKKNGWGGFDHMVIATERTCWTPRGPFGFGYLSDWNL